MREELEQIALLEGLTNERLLADLGCLNLISREDWIGGEGSKPLMAAFTHIGFQSRFSDGSYGVYYAANTLRAAIKETAFHRERFYSASNEPACSISMREYITAVQKPLKSLHLFMALKKLPRALRINADIPNQVSINTKTHLNEIQYQLYSLPFYLTEQIHRLLHLI